MHCAREGSLPVLKPAAGSFLAAEPGAFNPAGQAPVAARINAQVSIGQYAPLVRAGWARIKPAVRQAKGGGWYGAADQFGECA